MSANEGWDGRAECREETVQGATEFVTAQAKRDHTRNLRRNLEQCRAANLKPFTVEDLKDQSVWVDTKCTNEELDRALVRANLQKVCSRSQASVLIVADPTEPGERVLWVAIFKGAHVASPAVFLCGNGPGISYTAMPLKRRKIYFTPAFKEKHAVLHDIVHDIVVKNRIKGTKLHLVTEEASFLALKAKAVAQKRSCEVLGVGTQAEVTNGKCGGHLWTKASFTEWARQSEVKASGQCTWQS